MVAQAAMSPRDVLVVDDDEDLCEILGSTLQRQGHRVNLALDGALAVTRASERRPDIVLFDLGMPAADGAMLLEQLRLRFSPVPISIAMSGMVSAAAWCAREEVALFLVKPFGVLTLHRAIELATRSEICIGSSGRRECVVAVGDAIHSDRFVHLVDLDRAALVVVEADSDALRAMDKIDPHVVVVSDASKHRAVCVAAKSKGIPLLFTDTPLM